MGHVLGIDIGGTGMKAALVDTATGEFVKEKIKYGTPQPSNPKNMAQVLNQLIDDFDMRGTTIGCGFPAIVKNDICKSAANIDKEWLGVNLVEYFKNETGCNSVFMNDADAAGLAELKFGAGRDKMGTVIMITLGTGIGSGIFVDGKLVPNSEFGHLLYKKSIFEHYASNGARKKKELSWKEWGKELNTYFQHVELLMSPNLFILGGGVSKHYENYKKYIDIEAPIVPAQLLNNAGIVGAAMYTLEK